MRALIRTIFQPFQPRWLAGWFPVVTGAAGSSPAAGVACGQSRSGALWGCTTVARNAEYRRKTESPISLFALVSNASMRASECIGCFDACQQRVRASVLPTASARQRTTERLVCGRTGCLCGHHRSTDCKRPSNRGKPRLMCSLN